MVHNYYFVAFFLTANMFLLNVLTGFIIDNIVAYLGEDIEGGVKEETGKDGEKKESPLDLFKGVVKFYVNAKTAATGKVKDVGRVLLQGVKDSDRNEEDKKEQQGKVGMKVEDINLFK